MKEDKYYYVKHGLQFIVYYNVNTGFAKSSVQDSVWHEEEKAKEHCRILNEESE